jgi:hypothetical protein
MDAQFIHGKKGHKIILAVEFNTCFGACRLPETGFLHNRSGPALKFRI